MTAYLSSSAYLSESEFVALASMSLKKMELSAIFGGFLTAQ